MSQLPTFSDSSASAPSRRIPSAPLILGFMGLIPFLVPPLVIIITGPTSLFSLKLLTAVQTYGAIILSYMGAIHWALEMADRPNNPSLNVMTASVSPALFAFFCLQMDNSQQSMLLLAGGFAMLYLYDWSRRKVTPSMPRWYLKLRTPLTLGAITGLLVTAFL